MMKRCPWCGEQIDRPPFSSIGEYRCSCCGKKSAVLNYRLSYWIAAAVCFFIIMLTRSIWSVSALALMILPAYFSRIYAPLERIPRKYVPVKTCEGKAALIGEWSFIKRRGTFTNGRILKITFVNEDAEAISHAIVVSLSDISFDKEDRNKLTLCISFMPRNRKFCDFPAGTAFYLFDGKQRIAEGELTSSVNYPRLDIAEINQNK